MSFSMLALATDYDCWHESEEAVSVEAVVATLKKNITVAQEVVRGVATRVAGIKQESPFAHVVEGAVMTSKDVYGHEARRRLRAIAGELLG
jgi:5'-methylthioadenosine phosphorylase